MLLCFLAGDIEEAFLEQLRVRGLEYHARSGITSRSFE